MLTKSFEAFTQKIEEDIIKTLLSFDGVKDPHNLRTRKIGNRSSIEVHVRMDGQMTLDKAHDITRAMEKKLKEQLECLIYAYKFFASTTWVTLQYHISETPVPPIWNSSTS